MLIKYMPYSRSDHPPSIVCISLVAALGHLDGLFSSWSAPSAPDPGYLSLFMAVSAGAVWW